MNKATIGNDLILENFDRRAISIVRVLKRVSKDSRVTLAKKLSHKLNDIFYNKEDITKWPIVLTYFLFFFLSNQK